VRSQNLKIIGSNPISATKIRLSSRSSERLSGRLHFGLLRPNRHESISQQIHGDEWRSDDRGASINFGLNVSFRLFIEPSQNFATKKAAQLSAALSIG
jgi:hypothetical protein